MWVKGGVVCGGIGRGCMGGCAETGVVIYSDYCCFGEFGSVVVRVCGYVLGILRVLRPLSP